MSKLIDKNFLSENVNDILSHNERLCFITQGTVNINEKCLNCDSHGLVMFFSEKPETCSFENQNISYYSHPPFIDRDYIIVVIEDYLTFKIDGIENRIYQRDNWLRNDQLIKDNKEITLEMVNQGVCCWLYNMTTKHILDKNTFLFQALNAFSDYKIKTYYLKNF